MKHLFLSFSLAALTGVTFANPVSVQTAQTAASNFISRKVGSNAVLTLTSSVPSNTATAQPSFYIFDVNNGKGFVIISGDDAVTPVLAYSETNSFPAQVTNKEVAYWLGGYNQQISAVITNHLTASAKVAAAWSGLSVTTSGNTAAKPTDVNPIILTLWDQMRPNTSTGNSLYNNLCPTSAPTGCVATAMAQIMNFWQNPTTGTGMHSYTGTINSQPYTLTANFGTTSYDWANMPNTLTNNSSSTQKTAIATLMLHCGISVDMHYDLAQNGGSGAQVINYYNTQGSGFAASENAFPTYFGYKSTIKGVMRAYYTDSTWIKMLKFEIDNGRPVLYAGFGDGEGHAFDFDGYKNKTSTTEDMFDINWGWSGIGNGYYTVDNLAPVVFGVGGGNGTFNDGQQALIMIEPANSSAPANPAQAEFPTYTLALSSAIKQSHDTISYNTAFSDTAQIKNVGIDTMFYGTVYLIATDNSNASNSFILSQKNVEVNPGASITYTFATNGNSSLVPGVYSLKYQYVPVRYADTAKKIVLDGVSTNNKTLVVKAVPTSISNVALNGATLNVYPNPSHDFVTLDWTGYNGKVNTVELFNIVGQKLASYKNISGSNTKIPVSQLSAGNYIVNIVTDLGTMSKEISVK
jgi:hypothetical protein